MTGWAAALADAVLVLHAAIAVFVVGGLLAVLLGNLLGWRWVNRRGFRIAHLAAIAVVVAQAWLGVDCPLTTLEMWLRARSGGATYSGGFIEHWLQRLLFYEAPPWVFVLGYTVFGALVAAAWFGLPARPRSRPTSPASPADRRSRRPG